MTLIFRRWLLILFAASAACIATETGNPLNVEAHSSDLSVATLGPVGEAPRIEEAWVFIENVQAITGTSCDTIDELRAAGANGDVLSGIVFEAPPVRESCGVRLVTSKFGDDEPDGIRGAAAWVRGTRPDGVAFELRATSSDEIDIIGAPGLDLLDSRLVLSFDAAAWLQGVDLSGPADADGVVRVRPDVFDAPWLNSAELFVDSDGDGLLSDAERAQGAVATSR